MRFAIFNFFFTVLLLFLFSVSLAQSVLTDSLKVMTYNVLNYGFPSTSNCPSLITADKDEYLKTILRYEDPDILGLVKMDATPASFTTDYIIHHVLDSVCLGCYGHSDYTNLSGYTKENMLYFKTSKLGYVRTTTIYSADPNISDINMHTLFFKDPYLSLNEDTVFINVILVHDKSGSNNASNRASEIGGAMNWLSSHTTLPGNYIFMGDFNVQSSGEACFQSMVNCSNMNVRFYDPPNQLGDWAGTPSAFSNYLTEDIRINDPGDCGAIGGISTRFIHILCTQPILQGTASVQYIPGSYKVTGQDGNHTSAALTDPPANTSVPPQVVNALYYMSNHLPVSLQLRVNLLSTSADADSAPDTRPLLIFPNPTEGIVTIKLLCKSKDITIEIVNSDGKVVYLDKTINERKVFTKTIDLSAFKSKVYICKIIADEKIYTRKIMVN
jgi:hypothetical protein